MTSRSRRQTPLRRRSKAVLILAALGLIGSVVYLGIQLAKPPPRPEFDAPPGDRPIPPTSPAPEPAAEMWVEEPLPPSFEIVRQPPPGQQGHPRIALVIDDLGRSLDDLDTLGALAVPLTYSVLPFESRTPEVVAKLRRRQAEILLHLPMEAKGGNNPGPGALLLEMSSEELVTATRRALAAVPGAVGVNNHMGSGISARLESITTVVGVLAEESLYFVDSRTSPDTLGYSVARHLGVPAAERQVFLDNDRAPEAIRGQFMHLLEVARERGGAIAIGHPYRETLEVLATEIRAAREEGFEFVTASSLLDGA